MPEVSATSSKVLTADRQGVNAIIHAIIAGASTYGTFSVSHNLGVVPLATVQSGQYDGYVSVWMIAIDSVDFYVGFYNFTGGPVGTDVKIEYW